MDWKETLDVDRMKLEIVHRAEAEISRKEERAAFEEVRRILLRGDGEDDSGICKTIG